MDSEVLMREDEICGTTNPTPHQVLMDTRFELPFGLYICANTFSHKGKLIFLCPKIYALGSPVILNRPYLWMWHRVVVCSKLNQWLRKSMLGESNNN